MVTPNKNRTMSRAPFALTEALPAELLTAVVDALPIECTPAAMAASHSLKHHVLESRSTGAHRLGYRARQQCRNMGFATVNGR